MVVKIKSENSAISHKEITKMSFFFYYLEKVVLGREWLVVVSSVFLMQFKMLNEERRSQLKD